MSSIIQDIASQYIADKSFLFSICYIITILILLANKTSRSIYLFTQDKIKVS